MNLTAVAWLGNTIILFICGMIHYTYYFHFLFDKELNSSELLLP